MITSFGKYTNASSLPLASSLLSLSLQAFSAYYFVMNFLNLTNTSIPLDAVRQKIKDYCATPWKQVRELITYTKISMALILCTQHKKLNIFTAFELQVMAQHPDVKVNYLQEYCFGATYILTLLTEGYNFTSESYSNIKFIKKVSRRSQSSPFLLYTLQSPHPIYVISY